MEGARIQGNLICIGAEFSASSGVALNLQSSEIHGDGAFEYVAASADLRLRQASFRGTLTFWGSRLAGRLDLGGALVGGDLDFGRPQPDMTPAQAEEHARLGHALMLGGARVEGRVDMGTADLSLLTSVDFSRTTVGYLDDRDVSWPPEDDAVRLEGLRLGGIAVSHPAKSRLRDWRPRLHRDPWFDRRLKWLRAQGKVAWSPQPYGQVAAALGLAGEDKLARRVAIKRERDRRSRGGLSPISRAWNRLLGSTIAYGYRPYWSFGWASLVVLAGWRVFDGALGTVVFEHGDNAPHFYPLAYSIDAFLPIVDLGQSDAWSPIGLWPNVALWLEIGLGWVLTTLGVVGVTGLVRKD